MPPLIYHRLPAVATGASQYLIIDNLPACKLRVINMVDYTNIARWSIQIKPRNHLIGDGQGLSLVNRKDQVEGGIDIGWEGDIDLGRDQLLEANVENATAADLLYVTVGYELP